MWMVWIVLRGSEQQTGRRSSLFAPKAVLFCRGGGQNNTRVASHCLCLVVVVVVAVAVAVVVVLVVVADLCWSVT